MNAFCGAVNYKRPNIDFGILRNMSTYLGKDSRRGFTACAVPCCAIIYCGDFEGIKDGDFQPLSKRYGERTYMAAVLSCSDSNVFSSSEQEFLAESVIEGYVGEGMSYLERLCASVCAVIFNGAFGETVLISDKASDRAIYYALLDGTLYFSSELRALLRVIEIYYGRIKVDGRALQKHIMMPNQFLGEALFDGVECVRAGEGIIFSSFGISKFKTVGNTRLYNKSQIVNKECLSYVDSTCNACAQAESLLDIFGYPQFDIYLPSLIARLERKISSGKDARRMIIEDIPYNSRLGEKYLTERARIIGDLYGISIKSRVCGKAERLSQRLSNVLSAAQMKNQFEERLQRELRNKGSALYEIFDYEQIKNLKILKKEKNIPARARLAGMLYQTAVWFDKYNISF